MQITFCQNHPLKTHWLKGHLPSVRYGIYGGELTPDTCTIEHLVPKSKGGRTTYNNIALATKLNNNRRSSHPLKNYLTATMADEYLNQFRGVEIDDFSGDRYIRRVEPTIRRLLK